MPNSDFIEFFRGIRAKCEKCGSQKLLLFTETRIKNCVAWACYDCNGFQVVAKPEDIKEFFKNKNEPNPIS